MNKYLFFGFPLTTTENSGASLYFDSLIAQMCHEDACDQDKHFRLFPSLQSSIRILIDSVLFKMRIADRDGKETLRQVGAKPASALKALFETLATGGDPKTAGLSNAERFIRFGFGAGVAGIGLVNHVNWFLIGLGAVLMFSAIYDRCPIWQALTRQFKKLTGQA